jgi:hypothetical protein
VKCKRVIEKIKIDLKGSYLDLLLLIPVESHHLQLFFFGDGWLPSWRAAGCTRDFEDGLGFLILGVDGLVEWAFPRQLPVAEP